MPAVLHRLSITSRWRLSLLTTFFIGSFVALSFSGPPVALALGVIISGWLFIDLPALSELRPISEIHSIEYSVNDEETAFIIDHQNQVTTWGIRAIQFNAAAVTVLLGIIVFGAKRGNIDLANAMTPVVAVGLIFGTLSIGLGIAAVIVSSLRLAPTNLVRQYHKRMRLNSSIVPASLFTGLYGAVILIGSFAQQAGLNPLSMAGISLFESALLTLPTLAVGIFHLTREYLLLDQ